MMACHQHIIKNTVAITADNSRVVSEDELVHGAEVRKASLDNTYIVLLAIYRVENK